MPIRLYLDEDAMDDDLVQALRLRGVDVETVLDANLVAHSDEEQLAYAASVGRTLYTFNVGDFMTLHSAYIAEGRTHAGIIFGQQQRYSVGEQMRRLRRLIALRSVESLRHGFEFLSNWG